MLCVWHLLNSFARRQELVQRRAAISCWTDEGTREPSCSSTRSSSPLDRLFSRQPYRSAGASSSTIFSHANHMFSPKTCWGELGCTLRCKKYRSLRVQKSGGGLMAAFIATTLGTMAINALTTLLLPNFWALREPPGQVMQPRALDWSVSAQPWTSDPRSHTPRLEVGFFILSWGLPKIRCVLYSRVCWMQENTVF